MKRLVLYIISFISVPWLIGQSEKLDPSDLRVEYVDFNNQTLDGKSTYSIKITQDHKGYYWIGTPAGFFLDNRTTCINFSDYLIQSGVPLPTTTYRHVMRDKQNRIWMGTERGMFVYDISTHKLNKIEPPFPTTGDKRLVNKVFKILENNGIVYVASSQGFYMVDMGSLRVIDQYMHENEYIVEGIGEGKVESFYPNDENTVIWGSCLSGMYRVDRTRNTVQLFKISQEEDITGRIIPDRYFFYTGDYYGSKIYFPSYENGVMSFDTVDQSYDVYLIEEENVPREQPVSKNQLKGLIKYDDDQAVILSWVYGLGVFDLVNKSYSFAQPKEYRIGNAPTIDRHGYIRLENRVTVDPVFPPEEDVQYHLEIFEVSNNDSTLVYPGWFSQNSMSVYFENDPLSMTFGVVDYPKDRLVTYEYALNRKSGIEDWVTLGNENSLTLLSLPYNTIGVELRARDDETVVARQKFPIHVIRPFTTRPIFFILLSIVSAILLSALTYLFINRKRKREIKELQVQRLVTDLESKALRSQMNPHFIFNALNSIKSLIQEEQDDSAIDYLTKFSSFVRKVLSYSEEKLITLEQEVEMCKLYLEMEQLRFSKSLEYHLSIDPSVDLSFVKVPPMILQPFLENAIWHGLMHKEGDRILELNINGNGDMIECVIDDNGIGREMSAKMKSKSSTKHQSFGTRITKERLEKYEELTQNQVRLDIVDKMVNNKSAGTKVLIQFEV